MRSVIVLAAIVMLFAVAADHNQQLATASAVGGNSTLSIRSMLARRAADPKVGGTSMVHNHLSRKVFDRACAASKDTIEEIIACITDNETLTKTVKPELAAECHKDSFGVDFNPKDIQKHKEMICKNREKFEEMTACIYRKLAESLDPKEMDKLAEAMVDVGLCIINALDG